MKGRLLSLLIILYTCNFGFSNNLQHNDSSLLTKSAIEIRCYTGVSNLQSKIESCSFMNIVPDGGAEIVLKTNTYYRFKPGLAMGVRKQSTFEIHPVMTHTNGIMDRTTQIVGAYTAPVFAVYFGPKRSCSFEFRPEIYVSFLERTRYLSYEFTGYTTYEYYNLRIEKDFEITEVATDYGLSLFVQRTFYSKRALASVFLSGRLMFYEVFDDSNPYWSEEHYSEWHVGMSFSIPKLNPGNYKCDFPNKNKHLLHPEKHFSAGLYQINKQSDITEPEVSRQYFQNFGTLFFVEMLNPAHEFGVGFQRSMSYLKSNSDEYPVPGDGYLYTFHRNDFLLSYRYFSEINATKNIYLQMTGQVGVRSRNASLKIKKYDGYSTPAPEMSDALLSEFSSCPGLSFSSGIIIPVKGFNVVPALNYQWLYLDQYRLNGLSFSLAIRL